MEAIIETKTSATSADMTSMSTAEATTVSTTVIPISTTTTMATPTPRVSTLLSTVVSSSSNVVSGIIVKAADKPLRHGNGQWMDPVDQGTLFMMLAVGVTALVGAVYFYLRWRLRKKRHKAIAVQTRKVAVNKTFSRFSQVDEELTVHPDGEDREILQRYSQDCLYNPPPARPPSQPVIPAISGIQPVPVRHSKPYLETDM